MFTGIIEEIGEIRSIIPGALSSRLKIGARIIFEDMHVGDSISVNGVCLTVTDFADNCFFADVMAETMRRTCLGALRQKDKVNLERAMRADQRFGGHIVSGHIDGTGVITSMTKEDNAVWVNVRTPQTLLRYIVEKGSIAIDGISLTVAAVTESDFCVSLIPHTGGHTTLLDKKTSDSVNLECDIIAKYTEKLLTVPAKSSESHINESFLRENGFM